VTRTLLLALLAAAAAGTFLVSGLLTLAARHVALRVGFVDRPGGHKSHQVPIPYGGGSAVFVAAWGALLTLLLCMGVLPESWLLDALGREYAPYLSGARERGGQLLVILLGGLVLHALGLLDDRRPQPAPRKLLIIAVVGALVAGWGQVRIAEALVGSVPSVLLTVAWFTIIVNAFNFLDNMDGLSAGIACICLLFFVIGGWMADQVFVPALACLFLGAVAGFLVFNFPPARIFMGDGGSLVVGYMLATVSVMTTYYRNGPEQPPYALAMPLVILAIPLYDFASVVLIRFAEGRNPMQGDQRHFSHRLVDRGLSRRFAVLTIYLAAATTGLAATLLPGADLRQTLTIALLVLMVLAIIAILEAPLRKPR
jgi:UDP-GlcNAc:undecaprenyl-phosphate GlcNAc-1-phosphate transferase